MHHKLACEGGSGDTKDNRIENLRLFPSQAAHLAHHAVLRRAVNARAALAELKRQADNPGE